MKSQSEVLCNTVSYTIIIRIIVSTFFLIRSTVQVRLLLSHPAIDVNRRNNDRLTSFMLAMQGGQAPAMLLRNSTDNDGATVSGENRNS